MIYLKQSTASQEVLLGPFVDSTDGNTAETGLTIANTDIKIHKAGATTLANKNSGGATHISGGNYYAVFDATDTDTLGSGCIVVQVSGALAVRVDFVVLAANVYDSIIGGGDLLDVNVSQFGNAAGTFASGRPEVNTTHAAGTAWGSGAITAGSIATDAFTAAKFAADVTTELQSGLATASALSTVAGYIDTEVAAIKAVTDQMVFTVANQLNVNVLSISGDGTAADNLETAFDDTAGAVPWMGIVDQGTAQAATSTTLQLRSAAAFADDQLIGATIVITGGSAGVGQAREITDYVSSTDTATVDTWTTTPTGTITYKIFGGPPAPATAPAVNLTHIAGAAVSTTTAQLGVNVVQISGDATAADNLEAYSDGTTPQPVNVTHVGGTAQTAGDIIADTNDIQARLPAALVSGRMDVSVGAMAANVMTAAAAAADLTTELQSGLATSSALSTVAGYLDTEVAAILAAVDTEVGAIKAVTDKLDTAMELDSTVYRFTTNALENAPAGGGGGTSDWTTGEKEQIRHRLGLDGTATAPSATPSLATAAAVSTVAGYLDTEIAAIKAKTDNLPSDPADASDIAASFSSVASTLSTISGYLDTEVAAIKAKTDNLPASPAATGDIPTASTIADAVWDEVVDGTTTARQSVRLANSALGGEVSGADGTTVTIRDLADSKDRLTVTVDANGNRSSVTRDLT